MTAPRITATVNLTYCPKCGCPRLGAHGVGHSGGSRVTVDFQVTVDYGDSADIDLADEGTLADVYKDAAKAVMGGDIEHWDARVTR